MWHPQPSDLITLNQLEMIPQRVTAHEFTDRLIIR